MQKISARLLRVEKLANDVFEFEFSGEASGSEASREGLNFEPGQFMLLNVPAGANGEPPVSRAYSFAGTPSDGKLLFCIKLIPGGRGSEYLRNLKVGDTVELQGPGGHFTLSSASPEKNIVMVATGVGVAPFMGILKALFEKDATATDKRKVFLHFGVRHEEDIFYKEQLNKWKATHENFDFSLTLSQPSENWTGEKGRVTDHFGKQLENIDPTQTEIFICGNGAMVKEVKTMAEGKGFEKPSIHFELFTPIVSK